MKLIPPKGAHDGDWLLLRARLSPGGPDVEHFRDVADVLARHHHVLLAVAADGSTVGFAGRERRGGCGTPGNAVRGNGARRLLSPRRKPFIRAFREAFPDIAIRVLRTVSEGDLVASHCKVTGRLRYFLDVAKQDYRDVLFWWEYPDEAKIDTPQKKAQIRELFRKLGLAPPRRLNDD